MINIDDVEYKKIGIAFTFVDKPTDVHIMLSPLLGFKGKDIDITLSNDSNTNIVKIMGINRTNLTYFVFEKEINCIYNNIKVEVTQNDFDEEAGKLYVKLSKNRIPSINPPRKDEEVRDQQNSSSSSGRKDHHKAKRGNDESGPKKRIMFKETTLVVIAKFSSLLKCIGLSLRNLLHCNAH
ncbi:unnamed protein product [Cuscuta europaea]|uniref:Uncharacterized protein n=1 Tax=Cuscuta europaea TaxID=41803 RepID=A0A9P0YSR1_CUSEU|nr:unnamed protein product [Cuscuta europaea]